MSNLRAACQLTDCGGMADCGYMPVPGTDFDPAEDPPVSSDHPLIAHADQAGITQWGFDYAWQSDTPAQLVSLFAVNQAQFICRYLSDAVPGGKGIMSAEAQALQASGFIICPTWEVSGVDFTGGYNAGLADGKAAAAAMKGLGAPAGAYCWFCIDTGTSDFSSVVAYLQGAKAGTGAYIAQLYGSYAVVEAAAAAGLGSSHWQTYAWSAGKISSHAAIYQYQNAVTIGGISMDRDRTLQTLTGPWATLGPVPAPTPTPTPAPTPAPAPAPAPTPASPAPAFPYPAADYLGLASKDPHCHSGYYPADRPHIQTWQQQMKDRSWTISVDGSYGTASAQVCRAFQAEKGLTVDGKVGPVTWHAAWADPVT